jgi:hypothetical protein
MPLVSIAVALTFQTIKPVQANGLYHGVANAALTIGWHLVSRRRSLAVRQKVDSFF